MLRLRRGSISVSGITKKSGSIKLNLKSESVVEINGARRA
jgi:hypothetical protein